MVFVRPFSVTATQDSLSTRHLNSMVSFLLLALSRGPNKKP